MKNSFHLPTENTYDLKSKEFFQSKLASRLQAKYQPKPFEESYKPVYWIAFFASYFCNLFSILTASTFVFSYLFSILNELPYPVLWASMFSGIVLVFIEALQRFLAPKFFKDLLQFGFKLSSLLIVTVILTLSALSILFSYKGGFDVVDKLTTAPIYEAPVLKDIEANKKEFKILISEAGKEAEEYKNRKLYKSRLSDKHAKVYKDLLSNKSALQNKMIATLEASERKNEARIKAAKKEHKEASKIYKNSILSKGGGLAKFTIIAQILFFLCIFFLEFFDYKTATQYALLFSSTDESIIEHKRAFAVLTPSNNEKQTREEPKTTNRNKIGFKTSINKQVKSQLEQKKTAPETIYIEDKRTIEHNGKYYTMKDVNNFINIYQKRVNDAKEKNNIDVMQSRNKTLKYWKRRKDELITFQIKHA